MYVDFPGGFYSGPTLMFTLFFEKQPLRPIGRYSLRVVQGSPFA